ncbi:hypothetical protein RSJ21_04355 [Clostridium botulinum]|uniref:hypothetical protein n=1 Tax=Clostridium botulinum TaxID=1491 RepID=UPI000A16D015|nr:hypothetical protein [Clostridium botulinum]AUN09685.1 hypothetical protein RSJ6_03910 [Clostridium botulinum]AUN24513.1 hypothetical protein RSJ21_04355 [Clostridium botulinum]OSA72838.1 hypothetical protein B2H87_01580 [Clostridium botulinum]
MKSIVAEMPSLKKINDEIKSMKLLGFLGGKDLRNKIKEIEENLNKLINQIELFNERFSDKGWIAYDKLSSTLIEEVNKVYDENGEDAAEKVLITYYSSKVEESLFFLKNNCEELLARYNLILKAFEDHKEGRYHASVPLFLMIIDGAVNDYTKSKGFFAEGTDVSAWDCLVGCSSGLSKLKNIYCKGRNKTNTEVIYLPYRNGILHGRDLNYDNIFVSSKCIVLLFVIHDWMTNKKSEDSRRERFAEEQNSVSFKEIIAQLNKNQEDKKIINSWKPQIVTIGETIPESGKYEEYNDYEYIQKVLKIFEYWNKKNYGQLSKILDKMFNYEKSKGLRPKLCRELFQNKELISYRLIEVEERAISLRRVLVEAKWESNNKTFIEDLEFGLVYQDERDKSLLSNEKDGEWVIVPWRVQGLYKI